MRRTEGAIRLSCRNETRAPIKRIAGHNWKIGQYAEQKTLDTATDIVLCSYRRAPSARCLSLATLAERVYIPVTLLSLGSSGSRSQPARP